MEAMTWGFVGTLVGAVASIATTVITSWNSLRISQNSKAQDREERARAFQRETLLELQVEIRNYLRACYQAYSLDTKNFKNTGQWGSMLPEPLNDQLTELNAKTSILIQRVSNNELRGKLVELKKYATKCHLAKNEYDAGAFYVSYNELYEPLNEQLGEVLRNLY